MTSSNPESMNLAVCEDYKTGISYKNEYTLKIRQFVKG